MNRDNLERAVEIDWKDMLSPVAQCSGRLVVDYSRFSDRQLLDRVPQARSALESIVRKELVSSVLGDLETEVHRLRAALKKWGALAISRAEWRAPEGEEDELKEDLR